MIFKFIFIIYLKIKIYILNRYLLTSKGKNNANKIFENDLTANERKDLIEYTNQFKRYSVTELLKYVYEKYPEVTEKSEFKD